MTPEPNPNRYSLRCCKCGRFGRDEDMAGYGSGRMSERADTAICERCCTKIEEPPLAYKDEVYGNPEYS